MAYNGVGEKRALLGKTTFDGPTTFGFTGTEEKRKVQRVGRVQRSDGRVQQRAVGKLSEGLINQQMDMREWDKMEEEDMDIDPVEAVEKLEMVNVNGTDYNLTSMALDMMKRRGIDGNIPDEVWDKYHEMQNVEPFHIDFHVPCNNWKWFSLKNKDYWEKEEARVAKETLMIKDGRWLKMLKREKPDGFCDYVQAGEEILHYRTVAQRPQLMKNETFLVYMNETCPDGYGKLMILRHNNQTIEEDSPEPMKVSNSYLKWYAKLNDDQRKDLRNQENREFVRKLRNPGKGKPRYERPWRKHGFGRLEYPMRPMMSWEDKMAKKRMHKERQMKKRNDKQRKTEFKEKEAARRLARQRQKKLNQEKSRVTERLRTAEKQSKYAKMSAKERRRLGVIEDNGRFFTLNK